MEEEAHGFLWIPTQSLGSILLGWGCRPQLTVSLISLPHPFVHTSEVQVTEGKMMEDAALAGSSAAARPEATPSFVRRARLPPTPTCREGRVMNQGPVGSGMG